MPFNPNYSRLDVNQVFKDSSSKGDGVNLEQLTRLAKRQIELEDEIERREDELKEIKGKLSLLSRDIFPEVMRSADIQRLDIEGGYRFTLKDGVEAGFQDKEGALVWMTEHGYSDLISTNVSVEFKVKDFERAMELAQKLSEEYDVKIEQSVHHARLKSMMMECLETGLKLPEKFFKAHYYSETKITRKGTKDE